MALTKYKAKRDFKSSPEPTGGKSESDKLRFVIQKHDASHLHYDFRLEMGGVLKSWAVPKGPSTNPDVKRLAMMVEDHPYDYRNFEGIIPSGYGAGTVIVWDEGFYEPADLYSSGKTEQDKNLRHQLHQGKLKINLHGKKLNGEYALIKGAAEKGWLDEQKSVLEIMTAIRRAGADFIITYTDLCKIAFNHFPLCLAGICSVWFGIEKCSFHVCLFNDCTVVIVFPVTVWHR